MEASTSQNCRTPGRLEGQPVAGPAGVDAAGKIHGPSNGFVLCRSTSPLSQPRLEWMAPPQARLAFCRRSGSWLDHLVCWGQSDGDIHFCSDPAGSLTLLSGYVCGVLGGPELGDAAAAVRYLHAQLDASWEPGRLAEWLACLCGSFTVLYRNGRTGALLCVSDRMGSRPLWMKLSADAWLVSSHAAAVALAAESPGLELGSLGSFLLYGGPVDPQKSLFKGIQSLPPGTVRHIDGTGRVSDSRWYTFRHAAERGRSLDDWAKLAGERLTAAARRIVKVCPEPVLFLSGGVDSRVVAAALKSAGGNPLLVTLGDCVNLEVRIAQRAAQALGCRHEILLRDKAWYLRGLATAVFESGGSYVWTHSHFSQAVRNVRSRFGSAAFLLGDFSEAFSKLFCAAGNEVREPWSAEAFADQFDHLQLPLYRPRHRRSTLSLLKPAVQNEVEAVVREAIASRYAKLRGATRDPRILGDSFVRWETVTSLPTFMMFLDLRSAAAERNLMFDPEVHSLLEVLPSTVRASGNLGPRIASQLSRGVGWVPNSNSLLPMVWPACLHRLSKACKPILGVIRRWLLGNPHTTTGSWPNRAVLYRNHSGWRKTWEHLLLNGEWLDPTIFDRDAVRLHWHSFFVGDDSYVADIERLASVALASKMQHLGLGRFLTEHINLGLAESC